MGIKVPTVVDALFPGGKPLPAWGTGGDTVAALAADLPSEAAEGCGVSLVFSISSSVSIGGGSGGVLGEGRISSSMVSFPQIPTQSCRDQAEFC
jgi:hypothetical protein